LRSERLNLRDEKGLGHTVAPVDPADLIKGRNLSEDTMMDVIAVADWSG